MARRGMAVLLLTAAAIASAGQGGAARAQAQEDAQGDPQGRIARLQGRFSIGQLVELGGGAAPAGPIEGNFTLSYLAQPKNPHGGLQVTDQVAINAFKLKVGGISFVPMFSRAVITFLDGRPIKLLIGGAADGPYALNNKANDFKLIFMHRAGRTDGKLLGIEEFAVSLYAQPGASFVGRDMQGAADVLPVPAGQ